MKCKWEQGYSSILKRNHLHFRNRNVFLKLSKEKRLLVEANVIQPAEPQGNRHNSGNPFLTLLPVCSCNKQID